MMRAETCGRWQRTQFLFFFSYWLEVRPTGFVLFVLRFGSGHSTKRKNKKRENAPRRFLFPVAAGALISFCCVVRSLLPFLLQCVCPPPFFFFLLLFLESPVPTHNRCISSPVLRPPLPPPSSLTLIIITPLFHLILVRFIITSGYQRPLS